MDVGRRREEAEVAEVKGWWVGRDLLVDSPVDSPRLHPMLQCPSPMTGAAGGVTGEVFMRSTRPVVSIVT